MASPRVRIHLILTPRQIELLDELSAKLLLDRSELMRLAIARLAESEGIKP